MNFSQQQRDPTKHFAGLAFVIALHVLIVYALVTGLAKKVVDVVRAPIETKVIEEIKKPPPPPEIVVPPPPKLEAPPPPFIPPPEVQVSTPPPPQPTITAVTPTPPPEPAVIVPAPPPAPPAAPVAAAPPAAPLAVPKPVEPSIATTCTKIVQPELPASNESFRVVLQVSYTIEAGKITKVDIVKQSYSTSVDRRSKRAVLAAIEEATKKYTCVGDHTGITQDFSFIVN